MRHYPSDSPEAMARIVALVLMADGAIDLSEIETLDRHRTVAHLGLDQAGFDKVVHEFSEDMLTYAHRMPSGQLELDQDTMALLLGEIRNPLLQKKLLRTMLDIVNADGRLAGSEAVLVSKAMKLWEIDLYEILHVPAPRGRRWPPRVKSLKPAA
jgi:uncharacterized tellurite resistance protein B-like protein